MEAHLHEESKLWSFVVLCQSQSRMQGGKTEESNMKNSRGQQLLDTFRVLHGVPFMHTICFFKAWEFRSPTLQTVCKLELKQRSYGHLKTIASSYAKISQLRNELRKFRSPKPISQLRNELRNEIHLRNFARCFAAAKPPLRTLVPLRKLKLHLHSCEPRYEIHLCKLRYLPPTKWDFFSRYLNFYFLLVIS